MYDMQTFHTIIQHVRTHGIGHPTCSVFVLVKPDGKVTYGPLRVYFNRGHYEPFKPFPANDNGYINLA